MWSGSGSNSGRPRGGLRRFDCLGLGLGRGSGLGLGLSSLSLDLFISGRPSGGAASMGTPGRWLGLGQGRGSVVGGWGWVSISSLPRSSFHSKERKKIGCFVCT
jgi:hypothetical protein